MSTRTTTRIAAVLGGAALAAAAFGGTPANAKGPAIPDVMPDTMVEQPLQAYFDNYPKGPTVTGLQICDPLNNPTAKLAQIRENWMYYNGEDDTSGLSADVTISKYAKADVTFSQVVDNTGYCGWFGDVTRVDWAGQDAGTHAVFATSGDAAAVVRDGRYVIAVVITDWDGNLDELGAAKAEALKLEAAL